MTSFQDASELMAFARSLAARLTDAGFDRSAQDLRDWTETSFTTSSELLGELGLCCNAIVTREGKRLPETLRHDLDRCLKDSRREWSG